MYNLRTRANDSCIYEIRENVGLGILSLWWTTYHKIINTSIKLRIRKIYYKN